MQYYPLLAVKKIKVKPYLGGKTALLINKDNDCIFKIKTPVEMIILKNAVVLAPVLNFSSLSFRLQIQHIVLSGVTYS
jgi:hypothetical protein